jgi:transcriptional regulator with XRE-family HTH domain
VPGFVLKLARRSIGLTQEGLAEALIVDVTTVQGWESGRRSLAATSTGEFLRLTTRLARLGAPPSTPRHLTKALEADHVLSTAIRAGDAVVDADSHPLGASVHRRELVNLITWPITGHLPQQLREFIPKTPRRGPTATSPSLSLEERTRFFDHLVAVAQNGPNRDNALLRRQAVYLLGFDRREHVTDWLRDEWHRAGRRTNGSGGITGLLEARSAAVALASAGDSALVHAFVEQTEDEQARLANLTYWAHWIGELPAEQTSDGFMAEAGTRSWSGAGLLRHLTDRLQPDAPHLPLNLYTLHTLIAARPGLLDGQHGELHRRLGDVLGPLGSSEVLTRAGRHQVAGLRYALRIAERT